MHCKTINSHVSWPVYSVINTLLDTSGSVKSYTDEALRRTSYSVLNQVNKIGNTSHAACTGYTSFSPATNLLRRLHKLPATNRIETVYTFISIRRNTSDAPHLTNFDSSIFTPITAVHAISDSFQSHTVSGLTF